MTPVMPMNELGKWERMEAARDGESVKQWMCMCVSRGTFSVSILKMSVSASRVWTSSQYSFDGERTDEGFVEGDSELQLSDENFLLNIMRGMIIMII